MSHEEVNRNASEPQGDMTFELDATEEELLDEFGLLMAAEYQYMQQGHLSLQAEGGKITLTAAERPRIMADADRLAETRPDLHKLYERFRGGGGEGPKAAG